MEESYGLDDVKYSAHISSIRAHAGSSRLIWNSLTICQMSCILTFLAVCILELSEAIIIN